MEDTGMGAVLPPAAWLRALRLSSPSPWVSGAAAARLWKAWSFTPGGLGGFAGGGPRDPTEGSGFVLSSW